MDGYVAYETDKAWNFGIARDGTSFFLHEPLPDGASRLVVRDLDAGGEKHIHFGETLTSASEYERYYGVFYAVDAREIMVWPLHDDFFALGEYRFHAVRADSVREVMLPVSRRPHQPAGFHRRSSNELATTQTLENAIAAPARAGLR